MVKILSVQDRLRMPCIPAGEDQRAWPIARLELSF